MKKIFYFVLMIAGFTFPFHSVNAEAVLKEVCRDKMDKKGQAVKGKDGKVIQECKTIKTHKKLEGTPVPTKK